MRSAPRLIPTSPCRGFSLWPAIVAILGLAAPAAPAVRVEVRPVLAGVLPSIAELLADGPRPVRSASTVDLAGLVRRGWPLIVDFELAERGYLEINLGLPGEAAEQYVVNGERRRRKEHRIRLESRSFDRRPSPRLIMLRAFAGRPPKKPGEVEDRVPIALELYGIGAGKGALASLAFDRVTFSPAVIRAGSAAGAECGVRFRNSFNRAQFEIYREQEDGGWKPVRVLELELPDAGESRTATWDGHDEAGGPSRGVHQLCLRAWLTAAVDGSWLLGYSPDRVAVE